MIFNLKLLFFITHMLLVVSLVCGYSVNASESEKGLDISADQGSADLQTAISRLSGNVILKHLGLTVRGDAAEVQSANDNQSQLFIVTGQPVTLEQKIEGSNIVVKSNQLVYQPTQENMEFEKNVSVVQRSVNDYFEINTEQLNVRFKLGQAYQLNAVGKPVIFRHKLKDKQIVINAEKINWDRELKIVILHQAKVIDEQTVFSADEIKYNTLTGEISATGNGETRPNYRYAPEQGKAEAKEVIKTNDS